MYHGSALGGGELMADVNTRLTGAGVAEILNGIEDRQRRAEAGRIGAMMRAVTGKTPKMWGPSIVGCGRCRCRYESGREGRWLLTGLAPRRQNHMVYIMPGFAGFRRLMDRLGNCRTGKSRPHIRRLSDVDEGVLGQPISEWVRCMRDRCGAN